LDWVLAFKALLLGVVEGLTEFLPVSSTGHLIVAEDLVRFRAGSRDAFVVAIQAGAILALCWEYRARIWQILRGLADDGVQQRLALNIVIAFIPAAVLGVMFKSAIETFLFFPIPVATALVVGGLIILWVERLHEARDYQPRVTSLDEVSPVDAFKIGCAQCFALIPGTSRSGATIIGGLLFGFSRTAATQFSFFLAMPTVIGATVYALYQARHTLQAADLPLFVVGFVAAFISALLCVRWFLRYVSHNDFRAFAWYRIVFGGVILLTAQLGWVDWSD
jgi:undecaprenyl-diphosphatase